MVPKSKGVAGADNKSHALFPLPDTVCMVIGHLRLVLVGSCPRHCCTSLHHTARTRTQRKMLSRANLFVDVPRTACNAEITVHKWRCFGLSNWNAMQRARTEGTACRNCAQKKDHTLWIKYMRAVWVLMQVEKFAYFLLLNLSWILSIISWYKLNTLNQNKLMLYNLAATLLFWFICHFIFSWALRNLLFQETKSTN